MICSWTRGLLFLLFGSVLAAEKPCTVHDSTSGYYYDLNPLRANKYYEFKTDSGLALYMNVCGMIDMESWHTGLDESEFDIAGVVRRGHGDFAIGLVNKTLEIKGGGVLVRQSQGSPCVGLENERGSSTVLFICDTSVYSAGKPVLLDQWPSEDEKACHYEFEWRTHYACPIGERGFFGGILVFSIISAIILAMAFMVISTLYNRFVLRLRGFDQLPKFTVAHVHEIWDVFTEFFRSLIDYLSAAWNTRSRGLRSLNPTSHHWTSRDEEEALRASDPLEPDAEESRGAEEGQG